ncbi:MAG: diacylglycerol kinase family lipid kinase [Desulfarculus sp.]|nr:diacylglycerol kinase family lipid kinase [Desulfarculus sp.]
MQESPAITLIVNPASGRGRGRRMGEEMLAALTGQGLLPKVMHTQGRGHAQKLAAQAVAEGAGLLLTCGGDGTVQEVAQALAGQETGLAILPTGRCNDFARALGPLPTPAGLARALTAPRWRRVDLARADGRLYCTVGALGFDALVSRYVDQARLPFHGQPAYLWGVVRVLMGFRPRNARLTWDSGSYQGPLFLAAIANTPTYGNQIPIVPPARPDDGLLDVCLVKPLSFFRVLRLLPTLLAGRHAGLPEVSFLRTRSLQVESDGLLELWADGEPVGQAPLLIEVLPAALKVLDLSPTA